MKSMNCKAVFKNSAGVCTQDLQKSLPQIDILPKQTKPNNGKNFAGLNGEKATTKNAGNTQNADAQSRAEETRALITAAQNGDNKALEKLCIFYEPLFRKEMRRDLFYNGLGYDEGLSLARLKFIELVLSYNGADFTHFAGYVRCRIHYALYDELRKRWAEENKTAPLPQTDEATDAVFCEDVIERHELSVLLSLALAKLPPKQRQTIETLYINGYNGKETAALLNCTPAMVTKHHKQALLSLKNKIS